MMKIIYSYNAIFFEKKGFCVKFCHIFTHLYFRGCILSVLYCFNGFLQIFCQIILIVAHFLGKGISSGQKYGNHFWE